MLSEHKIAKEQVTSFAGEIETAELEISNSRFGIGIIMAMACFVGIWGCLCLFNGIAQTESVLEIGKGIVTAFTGI